MQSRKQIARDDVRGRGRAGDAGTDYGESHQERREVHTERLVRVQRGAGRLRIFAHELEVGERGQRRDDEREDERQPRHSAHVRDHVAGDRVDTGAENVADDEQQQQSGSEDSLEFRRFRRLGLRDLSHDSSAHSPVAQP